MTSDVAWFTQMWISIMAPDEVDMEAHEVVKCGMCIVKERKNC